MHDEVEAGADEEARERRAVAEVRFHEGKLARRRQLLQRLDGASVAARQVVDGGDRVAVGQ